MSAMKVMISTNPSVKSYQLVKVVSGGRAPGKSSFFFYCVDFLKYI